MVCQSCGSPVAPDVHFCPKCGAQVGVAAAVNPGSCPPPPVYPSVYAGRPPRVQRNLQMLGILWCVFGVFRVVSGLIGIFVMHQVAEHRFDAYGNGWARHTHTYVLFWPHWMAAFLPLIAVITAVGAILAFITGYALLTRQSWGRVLAIVVAVLSLLKFPIGTALGIYTLWVLAPSTSGVEYDTIAESR